MMRKNGKSLDTKRCTYQGAQISSTTPLQCDRQQGSCAVGPSTAMRVLRRLQYKSTAFQLKYSKDLRNYVAREPSIFIAEVLRLSF